MKEGDLFFYGMGEVDEGRIEGFDPTAGEVFKEAAKGDKMVGLS